MASRAVRAPIVAFAILVLMLPVGVSAADADICSLTQVPQYPSLNASMLLIIPTSEVSARMASLAVPIRVGYEVRDPYSKGLVQPWSWGAMKKFSSCYVCEFSGSVSFDASCGPTPFTYAGTYDIKFFANDANDEIEFNRSSFLVHPERFTGIGISIGEDRTVHVTADAPVESSEAWVSLYDSATGLALNGNPRAMNVTDYPGRYSADITGLNEGVYYAAFGFRTAAGAAGGDMRKITIAPVSEFSVSTDKGSYWIGETVAIEGVSKYSKVTGTIVLPDSRTVSLGSMTVSDGKYSHEFYIDKSYPKGDYILRIDSGTATVSRNISVSELFTLGKDGITITFSDRKAKITQSVLVTNKANMTIDISTGTEGITAFVKPTLAKTSLGAFTPTTLNVTADPVGLPTEGKSGSVFVSAMGGDVSIPVAVSLSFDVAQEECPQANGPVLSVLPALWAVDECLADSELNQSITIQNPGSAALSAFSASSDEFEVSGSFPSSIAASGTGSADISITAPSGFTSGYVEISSGSNKARMQVVTSCYEDPSYDIESLRDEIDMLSESLSESGFSDDDIASMLYPVESDLDDAESSLSSENYAAAYENLAKAQAGYDTLSSAAESMGSGGGGDSSGLVLIAALVVVAGLGIFIFMKFGSKILPKKSSGGDGEESQQSEELF